MLSFTVVNQNTVHVKHIILMTQRCPGQSSVWLIAVLGSIKLVSALSRTVLRLTQCCLGMNSAGLTAVPGCSRLDSALSQSVLHLVQRCLGMNSAGLTAVPGSSQLNSMLSRTVKSSHPKSMQILQACNFKLCTFVAFQVGIFILHIFPIMYSGPFFVLNMYVHNLLLVKTSPRV